ncbi:isochorismatase family protein [Streptomyces sp. NBC_00444]|uniref:isochorismatase family protein n=1 Tax=Streptomyces sp. NBC_00444 TaxID=2975744 RepID=UPI002E1E6D64
MSSNNGLIDPADAAVLLVDHQSGLLQIVDHVNVRELRNNVAALAKAATLAGAPVIATASVPEGPNGPLIPEVFENAPKATYVQRHGEINAWDVEGFRSAVEQTGRRTLLVAGIMTSICVVEPACRPSPRDTTCTPSSTPRAPTPTRRSGSRSSA